MIKLAEDLDFYAHLYPYAKTVSFLPVCSFYYLQTNENYLYNTNIDYLNQLEVQIDIRKWFQQVETYDKYRKYLDKRVADYIYYSLFYAFEEKHNCEKEFVAIQKNWDAMSCIDMRQQNGFAKLILAAMAQGKKKRIDRLLWSRAFVRKIYRRIKNVGKMFLYNHGGSANHGCEALVRTVSNLLSDENKITLFSEVPQQDIHYDIQKIAEIESAVNPIFKLSLDFLKAYIHLKRTGDYFEMDTLPYLKSIRRMKSGDTEISVGGDIYCYEDYPKFIRLHQFIKKRGCKSVLLGCSLDEKLFDDPRFVEDMSSYDYISARETLTYNLLKEAGLTNIGLAPDSAFTLPVEKLPLPEGFIEGNTVGINLSPLVSRKEACEGMVLKNYENMVRWILEQTDCTVALIPHVVWRDNDDRTVLKELYKVFKDTGRVVMIPDCNCMQLKGYISRCRLFVGARTHATIAAYSTCVPTLVVGYSIKSRGIATDLFGTDEGYVISVQAITKENDLSDALRWIYNHEKEISERLKTKMPSYVSEVYKLKERISSL